MGGTDDLDPLFAAGVINGIGHYFGYRNAESPDASTNILPWGILIGGEELHNNHHAWPGSAKLSYHWWEFDIGWFYIRLLQGMGLARVKRVSPKPARILRQAEGLDAEAVRAIINSRLQVLARYGRDVMKRVHREELRRVADNRNLKGMFKRVKHQLLRDETLLDGLERSCLGRVLNQSHALRLVYEYRQKLQAIWQQAASQPEKALRPCSSGALRQRAVVIATCRTSPAGWLVTGLAHTAEWWDGHGTRE